MSIEITKLNHCFFVPYVYTCFTEHLGNVSQNTSAMVNNLPFLRRLRSLRNYFLKMIDVRQVMTNFRRTLMYKFKSFPFLILLGLKSFFGCDVVGDDDDDDLGFSFMTKLGCIQD